MAQSYRAKIPVICVGNINVGGTGKTPTVQALIAACQARGLAPAVLSRGYKAALKGPLKVTRSHSASDVGDEPRLIADIAPVYIGANRAETAKLAEADGANLLIMDDGLQNPSLEKDLTFVVVDAERGFGNGHVIPAGPLREPVSDGLARADALISIGREEAQSKFRQNLELPAIQHFTARVDVLPTGMPWKGTPCVAFAGIGHPEKFFATLKNLGADLRQTIALSDHQEHTPALLERLKREAAQQNAQLVTTEKDMVRLPQDKRAEIIAVPIRLIFDDPTALDTLLDGFLQPPN